MPDIDGPKRCSTSSISRCGSPEPPKPIADRRLRISSKSNCGCSSTCMIIDGAAWKAVTRWSRIISIARAGSHLCTNTRRRPLTSALSNCACSPLTWNSGTAVRIVGASPRLSSSATTPGEEIADSAAMNSMLYSAWHTARCVDSTALAREVEPEVNSSSPGSLGPSCTGGGPSRWVASSADSECRPEPAAGSASHRMVAGASSASLAPMRLTRSASASSTLGCTSASAALSSACRPKLLIGAGTAPASAAPMKATAHSGRLRIAMATRSPGCTPNCSRSAQASESAAANRRSNDQVSPS